MAAVADVELEVAARVGVRREDHPEMPVERERAGEVLDQQDDHREAWAWPSILLRTLGIGDRATSMAQKEVAMTKILADRHEATDG